MSWKNEVDEIERRRALALDMGGEAAVARQHDHGRRTIRERIESLADPGSFYEQGPISGSVETDEDGEVIAFAPANYVLGLATLDGRPCVIGGEDFTQRGGSPSPAGLRKSVYAEELACRQRVPLVRFLEGGGGSVKGGGKSRPVGEPVYSPPRFESLARQWRRGPRQHELHPFDA